MPVVSVTRLHLRSIRFLPVFLLHAIRSTNQAMGSAEFLGGWTGREPGLGFWTATTWESLEAMRAFRNATPHLGSMKKFLHWCDEGAYVHWEQHKPDAIDAATAYEHMAASGRVSKVLRPSSRHRAGSTVGTGTPTIDNRFAPRHQAPG